jgi:uncharacterized protein YheU (UPF0270 family)
LIIAWQDLSEEALQGVIEEFITREGTDYGHAGWSLEQKVSTVRRQLEAGSAVLVYDEASESCSLAEAVNGKIVQ